MLSVACVGLLVVCILRRVVLQSHYRSLNQSLLSHCLPRLLTQLFVLLLLVLALRLQNERLSCDAHDVLFRVEDRRVLVAWGICNLVASAHWQHWLLHYSYHAVRTLLREWNLLFLFCGCVLLDERGLDRVQQVHRHVVESRICNLVHVAQRSSSYVLLGVKSDINQVWFMLLRVTHEIVGALAPYLPAGIFAIAIAHAFVGADQGCLHRVLTGLSCLRSEPMWHYLVELFNSVELLTRWKHHLICLRWLVGLILYQALITCVDRVNLADELAIVDNRHFLTLDILKYACIRLVFSNRLLFAIDGWQPLVLGIVADYSKVVLLWSLNEW